MTDLEEIEFELGAKCHWCDGDGAAPPAKMYWCSECGGSGMRATYLASTFCYSPCLLTEAPPYLAENPGKEDWPSVD